MPTSLILASGSSGFTKTVGCTCTHLRPMLLPPIASPILTPSLVVGKCVRSGRYDVSNDCWVKSAPKPPDK